MLLHFCELQVSCAQGLLNSSAHTCLLFSYHHQSTPFTRFYHEDYHSSLSLLRDSPFVPDLQRQPAHRSLKRISVCLSLNVQTRREGGYTTEEKVRLFRPKPPSTVPFVKAICPRYFLIASLSFREITKCKTVFRIIVFISIGDFFYI